MLLVALGNVNEIFSILQGTKCFCNRYVIREFEGCMRNAGQAVFGKTRIVLN